MTRAIRVLVADDEKNLRELMVRELARKGHQVDGVADGEAALARLREAPYDVVVLDMKMPRKEGIEVLRELAGFAEHPQVIVMTGFQEVSTAVEAMKLGAYDYLTKPTKIEELDVIIRKAAEKGQLLRDNVALRARLPGAEPFGGILTRSPRMQEVLRMVERVAPTDSAVLILGESGTGKELVARGHPRALPARRPALRAHPLRGAARARCWSPSCSATRRAPSPARWGPSPASSSWPTAARSSSTRSARWSRRARCKLLRVLESGMFFRVGGTRPRRVDVRLVAATNRDLAEALKQGEFRQDLYYRINTITIQLPPLRERREDVALLARHFVEANVAYGIKRLGAGRPRGPGGVSLAGQRARAPARHRARGDPLQGRGDPAARLAARGRGRPPHPGGHAGGGSLEAMERQHIVGTLREVGDIAARRPPSWPSIRRRSTGRCSPTASSPKNIASLGRCAWGRPRPVALRRPVAARSYRCFARWHRPCHVGKPIPSRVGESHEANVADRSGPQRNAAASASSAWSARSAW